MEAAIGEEDKRDLIDPERLRAALDSQPKRPGLATLKDTLDWPDLGLIVETDGLRYHRTPARQAADRIRDQRQTAAGLTPLRFTHEQVRYDPGHVQATLQTVAYRLRARIPECRS